jgi:hypothetical protein
MRTNKTYKGIVIKVTSTHIVLMCDGGLFKNAPRTSSEIPKIGQPYVYTEKGWSSLSGLHYIAMASILFLSIIGYTIFSPSMKEESYLIAIDINPSIEIFADEKLSIIDIKALNKDGQKIIESINPKIKKLDQIVKEIVEQSVKQNYLSKTEKGAVVISVIPLKENASNFENSIQDVVKASLEINKVQAEVNVSSETKRVLEKAKQVNLSINKYLLYEDLKNKGIDLNIDVFRNQSIVQIKKIREALLKKKYRLEPTTEENLESPLENKSKQTQTNPAQKETSKTKESTTNHSTTKAEGRKKSGVSKNQQDKKKGEEEDIETVEEEEKETEEESEEPEADEDLEQEENEEKERDEKPGQGANEEELADDSEKEEPEDNEKDELEEQQEDEGK